MQAIRLARPRVCLRRLATTASPSAHVAAATSSAPSVVPLSNVEAQWEKLSKGEQLTVHQQLEELQKKDWKTLSTDEKKAAYYVAFGPHGPRAPVSPPGDGLKIAVYTLGLVGVAGLIFATTRSLAGPAPKTLTKEWEEASNERAREQKMNPISGITSEGYSGKGFVTHK
ncbi:COX4, subunit IV of cytochrome c oxidase [Serpula lacrymans var. lacrymans S7.3]|uniref:COX4, subunit IV of cytochrome c oxidase n=2 Tax=Serpula lacrymans var. lacrymans TaxID=341189 RepID=F8Q8G9_SERL3|nr:subunit IV of cytochrome c oxidase,COX4 [Serpula lacrymans var. lacrymans S7.9]EGN95857.1 COX4, subunit IV of cytochrome c oxidase [Serpula lacrymans var. lacrymans S7.3]EGO21374.1 subunit IV of cytochrome c oxidase,COX4 [Serpula lacrymans var. lacrymans S7.9]